jgi:hypothetical protein
MLLGAVWGYQVYHLAYVLIPNSYAAWTTGDLIVEYIDTHEGKWPRGWDDLRVAKQSLERRSQPVYYAFQKLPQMIKVDWSADPTALAKLEARSNEVPFEVVTKLDGSKVDARWGEDTEPNRKIYVYLKNRTEAPAPNHSSTGQQ